MDEAEKILRQDILEVMGASGEAALANPRLFVSSLLDVDAGRTREAKVLANNCTDQLLGIYSAAGRDAQALNLANSKAKSYLTNDRLLREDVSAAIADAFEEALCRYYGVAPVKRTQTSQPQPQPQSEPKPEPQPQPQRQPQPKPKPQPQPQPQSKPQPQPQSKPQQPQPSAVATPVPQQDSSKGSGKPAVVWVFAIIMTAMVCFVGRDYLAKGWYGDFVLLAAITGIVTFFGSAFIVTFLRNIVFGKGRARMPSVVGLLVSLAHAFALTFGYGVDRTRAGIYIEPLVYVVYFILILCISAIVCGFLPKVFVALSGKKSRK